MAIASPFLPVLAALSGEASAMRQAQIDAVAQERYLAAVLTGEPVDMTAMGGPEADEETKREPREPEAPIPEPAPALLTENQAITADEALIDGRRRPGEQEKLPEPVRQENIGAVRPPPPEAFPGDSEFPIPDRWRLTNALGLLNPKPRFFDPYNQNTFKGDRPLCIPTDEEQERRKKEGLRKCRTPKILGLDGDDWFLALSAVSDTVVEPRTFPIPVGNQTTSRPSSNDLFGKSFSPVLSQTFLFGGSLIKGSTAYKPPEIEYRALFAYNINYVDVPERRVLFVEPSKPSHRLRNFFGVQELFVDYHIRNVSDRYDFDSVRVGIQPFQADFRGFLFNDNQLGIRFFGNRDNNRFQYNLAAFWRLEKDTNSGLNDLTFVPRDDFVFFANLYRQDFPFVGITSQISATVNINREGNQFLEDKNGFPARPSLLGDIRPHAYKVAYLGYSADGRIGKINLTASAYAALGKDDNNFFTTRPAKIRSWFFAAEPSIDLSWARLRLSALYASGDANPFDDKETGFDAVFENPIFAGADTSYWIRQSIPFAGGGRGVNVNTRNGILNNLRTSKEQGQSNFNNPGTMLLGVGGDFDLTPTLRISSNINHLWFANTSNVEALRVQGNIPKTLGVDASVSAVWRPKAIQNVVFRLSGATFDPGRGFGDLFGSTERSDRFYSVLFNAIVTY